MRPGPQPRPRYRGREASAGRPASLRPGELAALAARCLPLLPSGPGGVHRATLRETRSSTRREPSGAHANPGQDDSDARENDPRIELATSGSAAEAQGTGAAGGEAGIRTRGGVSPTHALQACSFNRSDTSPRASHHPLTARWAVDGTAQTWRRGWDSNPRGSCPPTRFRGGPVTTTSVPLPPATTRADTEPPRTPGHALLPGEAAGGQCSTPGGVIPWAPPPAA